MRRLLRSLSLLLPALWLAACTPLDPKPFNDFAATTASIGPALDAAFALDMEWTEAGLRERLVESSPEEFKALGAEVDETLLEARRAKDPLYIQLRHARRAAAALNAAATGYAALLASLAGDGAMEQSDFDRLAGELQQQTIAATQAFEEAMQGRSAGYEAPGAARAGAGIFSVAAAEAFRMWIEHERREELAEALQRNQPTVDAWAALLKSCVRLIAADLRDEYQSARRRLGKVLLQSPSEAAKRSAATELLRREDELRTALETLQALDRAYAALGPAHADLRKHVSETEWSLDTLKRYQAHAKHLQKLHKELAEQNGK